MVVRIKVRKAGVYMSVEGVNTLLLIYILVVLSVILMAIMIYTGRLDSRWEREREEKKKKRKKRK